jgi:DNA repair exonuclease SbcCD ATPase subunit/DNA repair exonuclease SbcCD nuclease subunit
MLKLAHLADIHIQDRRRDEYDAVIKSLYASLRAEAPALIVLAGDVFDSKTKASAHNMSDVANFLTGLVEIAPVVLIPGNHDTNVATPGALDMLTPIVADNRHLQPPRLTFWRNSGVYAAHGILWTVVATDGEKPSLAETEAAALQHGLQASPWVCLFHEEVNGALFPTGLVMREYKLSARDFDPYDAALGGHIHLRQQITARAAYCGSLVQQNIGERHNGHGYLVWELSPSTAHTPYRTAPPKVRGVDIRNSLGGYLRVELAAGKDITEQPVPLKPRYWEIAYDTETSRTSLEMAIEELTTLYEMPPRSIYPKVSGAAPKDSAEVSQQAQLIRAQDDARSVATHDEIIAKQLGPEHPQLANVIKLHHERFADLAGKQPGRARLRLLRLEFDNLYCYGVGNAVDFTKLEGCVSGVVAPNFAGKSSLIDVLLFALYEHHPRAATKVDMVHAGALSYRLALDFELDGKPGRFEKSVRGATSKHGLAYNLTYAGENLTQGSGPETLKEARALFGDAKHALASSIMLQGAEASGLISATPSERKRILAEVLALGAFAQIERDMAKRFTEVNAVVKSLDSQFRGQAADVISEEHERHVGDAEDASAEIKRLDAAKAQYEETLCALRATHNDARHSLQACRLMISNMPVVASAPGLPAATLAVQAANDLSSLLKLAGLQTAREAARELAAGPTPSIVGGKPTTCPLVNEVQTAELAAATSKQAALATRPSLESLLNAANAAIAVNNDRLARARRDLASAESASTLAHLSLEEQHELATLELGTPVPVTTSSAQSALTDAASARARAQEKAQRVPNDTLAMLASYEVEALRTLAAKNGSGAVAAATIEVERLRAYHAALLNAIQFRDELLLVDGCQGCARTRHLLSGEGVAAAADNLKKAQRALAEAKLSFAASVALEVRECALAFAQAETRLESASRLAALRQKRASHEAAQRTTELVSTECATCTAALSTNSRACAQYTLELADLDAREKKLTAAALNLANARRQVLAWALRAQRASELATQAANAEKELAKATHEEMLLAQRTSELAASVEAAENDLKLVVAAREVQQKILATTSAEAARLEERLRTETARAADYTRASAEKEIIVTYRSVIRPDGGIADVLLERARLDLEKAINESLAAAGAKFVISIDASFELRHGPPGMATRPVSLASGYQKFALGLAARIALWRLAAVPLPDCLIIDEGFSACDEDNQESMAQCIETLASSAGAPRLVFIVSHIDALKNRIERALTIEVLPGGSRVCNTLHQSASSSKPAGKAPALASPLRPAVKRSLAITAEKSLAPDPDKAGNVWCDVCSQSLRAAWGGKHLVTAKHAAAERKAATRTH